jgi:hypothetical protein
MRLCFSVLQQADWQVGASATELIAAAFRRGGSVGLDDACWRFFKFSHGPLPISRRREGSKLLIGHASSGDAESAVQENCCGA